MKDLLLQLLPVLAPLGAAILILLIGSWFKRVNREFLTVLSVLGLAASIWFSFKGWLSGAGLAEQQFPIMLKFDGLALIGFIMIATSAGLSIIASYNYLMGRGLAIREYLTLILFAVFGACIMASGVNLIAIFIGLEILSLSAYVLAGYNDNEPASKEASIKYFILGSVASAFFLFGIAFYYGATGTFDLSFAVVGAHPIVVMLASGFIISGLAFKVAAVPFQWWTPDVYQGAPLPVTTFFATTVKAAAFIAFFRVLVAISNMPGVDFSRIVTFIAVATMIFGNLAALFQEDIKRMLAYSSIAHAGYLLISFVFLKQSMPEAQSSMMFYLLAYILMTAGAFTVLSSNSTVKRERSYMSDLAGLGKRDPWTAFFFTVFLLSLAGFPPTAGFFAKFYIFKGAIQYGHVTLVIIAVLNSLVSVYYYMRPVVAMYFGEASSQASGDIDDEEQNYSCAGVIIFCAVAVMALGVLPSVIISVLAKS